MEFTSPRRTSDQRWARPNPEMKMFIKIALAAVIVVSAAAMASAATRSHKTAVYRSDPRAQATVPRTPRFSNPDSPAATGGGSFGYNQNITVFVAAHVFSFVGERTCSRQARDERPMASLYYEGCRRQRGTIRFFVPFRTSLLSNS